MVLELDVAECEVVGRVALRKCSSHWGPVWDNVQHRLLRCLSFV